MKAGREEIVANKLSCGDGGLIPRGAIKQKQLDSASLQRVGLERYGFALRFFCWFGEVILFLGTGYVNGGGRGEGVARTLMRSRVAPCL